MKLDRETVRVLVVAAADIVADVRLGALSRAELFPANQFQMR
jgi:hypothetical protein